MNDQVVLAFILSTGKIIASVLPETGIQAIFDKGLYWYQGTDIETGELFLINLGMVEQVRIVSAEMLLRGGSKIVTPGGFRSH